MKFCRQCHRTAWPFLFAIFIAGVAAGLTWMMLSFSPFEGIERMLLAGGVFVAITGTLVHYMLACMKRHCRHTGHSHSHRHTGVNQHLST